MSETHTATHGHNSPYPAWTEWLFTTDAKKIGMVYMIMAFIYFFVGGICAGAIRIQLATPTMNFVDGVTYNGLVSMHGTVMIFLWVMPFIAGIINFVMPLQIGARDMAFPRLNAMGLWLFNAGALVLMATFLLGMPQAGWTSYAPLSTLDKKEIGMEYDSYRRIYLAEGHEWQIVGQIAREDGKKYFILECVG